MSQPIWKLFGRVGDVDPIAYGGGFVYTDETGVYCPEMTWFEPASDEEWHKTEGATPLRVYRVLLENDPTKEWWFSELQRVADSTGRDVDSLRADAGSPHPMDRAAVYQDLLLHFGAFEFDDDPITMTKDEAYTKYTAEMAARTRR